MFYPYQEVFLTALLEIGRNLGAQAIKISDEGVRGQRDKILPSDFAVFWRVIGECVAYSTRQFLASYKGGNQLICFVLFALSE